MDMTGPGPVPKCGTLQRVSASARETWDVGSAQGLNCMPESELLWDLKPSKRTSHMLHVEPLRPVRLAPEVSPKTVPVRLACIGMPQVSTCGWTGDCAVRDKGRPLNPCIPSQWPVAYCVSSGWMCQKANSSMLTCQPAGSTPPDATDSADPCAPCDYAGSLDSGLDHVLARSSPWGYL